MVSVALGCLCLRSASAAIFDKRRMCVGTRLTRSTTSQQRPNLGFQDEPLVDLPHGVSRASCGGLGMRPLGAFATPLEAAPRHIGRRYLRARQLYVKNLGESVMLVSSLTIAVLQLD